MAKAPGFGCTSCGATSLRWVGRCGGCGEFGTVAEVAQRPGSTGLRGSTAGTSVSRPAQPVAAVAAAQRDRQPTGLAEFDRVLGGGLVPGQVVLVAGEPGVGKSTLLATAADSVARARPGRAVLYLSGEESVEQLGLRARRIGADAPDLLVADETDLGAVLAHVEQLDPQLLVVDSVQALASAQLDGRAGGMAQVQEVTAVLTRVAKGRRMPVLLVGQSTRENAVAGPRALEHMVDTVLTFEGDRHTSLRLLRAVKNRFGPADEVVCFEQAESGLREVADPADLFRGHREIPVPGTCVGVSLDGRRAVPAEVQALVSPAASPAPRRGVTGLDAGRVAMLVAVTERCTGLRLGDRDVFVATVGGARLTGPATDLAACLALASAAIGTPMPRDVVAIGEVALSGDIRPVAQLGVRLAEAARVGFRTALVPPLRQAVPVPDGLRLVEAGHLSDVVRRAFGGGAAVHPLPAARRAGGEVAAPAS